MMKIDWARKLTSRKFWAAIIGFVTSILLAFGATDMTISQITGIISAASIAIAYIIGEGLVDVASIKANVALPVYNYTINNDPNSAMEMSATISTESEGNADGK